MDQSWSNVIIDQSTTFHETTIAYFQWTTINVVTFRQYFRINDQFIVSVSNGEKCKFVAQLFSFVNVFLRNFFQFELQQEDFPPLPHRSQSHESTSTTSTSHVQPSYQSQFSSPGQSNLTNGYVAAPTQQPQSQSPISFKSSIEPFSALISRQHNKTSPSSTTTISQSGSTITDQYGLVGLLQMIQQAEQKTDSSILLNFDLTTLGLSKTFFSFSFLL